ncbi:MAG: hypothetical protein IJE46_06720 [Clostridia bacterium]|nr:hypothetical protein [Clostridia bacterium]
MAEFRECPFCGSKSIGAEISYEEKNFRIYCDECPAEMILYFVDAQLGCGNIIGFGEMQSILQEMIDKWNTRTPKEREVSEDEM